jgi:enoyl-CoA hydratase/carnithine racemase
MTTWWWSGTQVGSFDAGYGSTQMSRLIGPKRAKEMWFLCRLYDAKQAMDMGLVNTVVPLARLEEETLVWCVCLNNLPLSLLSTLSPQQYRCDVRVYTFSLRRALGHGQRVVSAPVRCQRDARSFIFTEIFLEHFLWRQERTW